MRKRDNHNNEDFSSGVNNFSSARVVGTSGAATSGTNNGNTSSTNTGGSSKQEPPRQEHQWRRNSSTSSSNQFGRQEEGEKQGPDQDNWFCEWLRTFRQECHSAFSQQHSVLEAVGWVCNTLNRCTAILSLTAEV